ncbi:glycoside hydrolase 100 family protein [Parasediminibacterium sp. JCM 36343]|uniref:glycoside hydrolase 100 family protein n=1 Tax=Parasediminibacterium sp. JCM 36343 TaxID=3374279 RepID=UPI003977F705
MYDIQSYNKSIELLKKASTPAGFVAAVQEKDNYRRVWARDGNVCSMAALLSGDAELINTARATIETLFTHQHPNGNIPSNVTPETKSVSYGGIVGRADNPSWAVIGLCQYTLMTGDTSLSLQFSKGVEKCLNMLEAWEYNGRHLVYVPQSGDWADEYIQHGYILFEQLLRVWALRLAARVYGNADWAAKAAQITTVIKNNYWQQPDPSKLYARNWAGKLQDAFKGYWLMGFNPSRIYAYFDLQANALALLLNIGDAKQDAMVTDWVQDLYKKRWNNLLPSFYPTILDTDEDMKELLGNYAYTFRNNPYEFHNGGLWPVWNGWMALALAGTEKKEMATSLTAAIHKANNASDSHFNECLQGLTNAPCGIPQCAWSAAGAIIAEQGISGKRLITTVD